MAIKEQPPRYIKKAKAEVNYRNFQACRNCNYFYPTGICELVDGPISPEGVCNLWETMERPSVYRDKEFFQQEFSKKRNR
ncbi:hypothetical protein LCGC14_2573410 [marine sediment metagenome]|uniref:Uncharacterized protein n=1 Tax=marine sediment metagenome TaxID=412755 RepID=A0A0F9CSR2_9ZZZZ